MASQNAATAPIAENSPPNQRRQNFQNAGRGRVRVRGGRGNSTAQSGGPHQETGRRDGFPGRRGRGGPRGASSGHARQSSNAMNTSDLSSHFSQTPALGDQSAQAPRQTQSLANAPDENEVEAEVCFICASPVVHNSVAPCNHRTCHICALRMRALYKTKDCAHCRTEAQYVIFTDDPAKRFEDYGLEDIVNTDENIGIKYEKADIVEDTLLLLRYNCPDPSCDVACLGWPDLHRHVRNIHHKKMCDLCTRNKKVFTHEHELFTDKELERHMKKGDDNPGAIDQSGFKGHPLCGFCGERFYGDDELYVHCRDKHERCFLCDRRDGMRPHYYVNNESLQQHFRKDHFPCPAPECLEKRFIVFPSELDLKAHQLEEHGSTLSKDVRRDARVVDISSFDYRAPYVQERRGGAIQREGRGRGRGRDPNTDPIPASSAQPLRRDEQAFQRQMAIQSAQSVSTRTFGGQLTPALAAAGRVPPTIRDSINTSASRPLQVEDLTSQVSGMGLQENTEDLTTHEQTRRLRHAYVIERATVLLQNDQLKLTQFRNSISSFRTNSISAAALIDSFFALFSDTSSTALGSVVREVADLYEDNSKAEALRKAWNDWRAINEDYPSLPGPSGMSGNSLPMGWAQVTSSTPSAAPTPPKSTSRVLKLKSSTAQSSRSSASRNASWGSASASSANGFPGLPAPTNRAGPTSSVGTAPWVSHATSFPAASSNPSSARPTPPTSRPASRGPPRNILSPGSDAFPALPPAAKPTTTIFGYGTGAVRRDVGGSNTSAFSWGAGTGSAGVGAGAGANDTPSESEALTQHGVGVKKKGNKGKKQILVQWG